MTQSTNLPVTEEDLMAFVDSQLHAARRTSVESWLAARPEEMERMLAYRRQNEVLHALFDPVLDEPVPGRLRRVAWTRLFGRLRPYALAAGFMLLGLAVGTLTGWQLHASRAPLAAPGLGIAKNAAVAHATYSPEVRHPVEVGADQEAHLIAWLSKRLGTSLRAPKLDASGFNLVGGRLLPGEAKPAGGPAPVAQFMYQTEGGRRLTLYVRTEAANNRETVFRYALEGSVGVFYWIDRNVGYALSSADLGREELLAVANSVYRQLNP
ncbi:MAG: anti-sigma factor [Betaproteobacteria bacterium]|nr:anti-sigma factor [Betaproteobacteria bacterium]